MRLLTTITITITATTTLLATPTTAKAIEPKFHMETPCTPERESHRVCMIPKVHDNPAYTRDNMVVECEMGKWRIVERCHRWMPCMLSSPFIVLFFTASLCAWT
ncbi:hypothetical protein DE146DRAFT_39810 [Phaeosphaeria sp. MPI-PUGE-AT-0046c]|nr:hypothetical protein DE146DRAFT_39810 [Phaeosphaeria sp. MPI-PUGE-AT-0046c]